MNFWIFAFVPLPILEVGAETVAGNDDFLALQNHKELLSENITNVSIKIRKRPAPTREMYLKDRENIWKQANLKK